jgi:hypothetical protein
VVEARNPQGALLASFVNRVFPTRNNDQETFSYLLAPAHLRGDALSTVSMSLYGHTAVHWTVAVLDIRGRVLARSRHATVYTDSFSPRLSR